MVAPMPIPSGMPGAPFVILGTDLGPSVNKKFAQEALDHMNRVVESDCVKNELLKHEFKSLKNIEPPQVKERLDAYRRYISGAPYALNLRWYRKSLGNVIGYTYNYKSGSKASETRIWSNTRMMSTPKRYAAHLAHELSHQARAGAFVHYSFHQGSFPYEIGDIFGACLNK